MLEVRLGKRRLHTHNGILTNYAGADGMKTGFICDSGFNVVASATRAGSRSRHFSTLNKALGLCGALAVQREEGGGARGGFFHQESRSHQPTDGFINIVDVAMHRFFQQSPPRDAFHTVQGLGMAQEVAHDFPRVLRLTM
jgi:hypothetical protein